MDAGPLCPHLLSLRSNFVPTVTQGPSSAAAGNCEAPLPPPLQRSVTSSFLEHTGLLGAGAGRRRNGGAGGLSDPTAYQLTGRTGSLLYMGELYEGGRTGVSGTGEAGLFVDG